MNEKDKKMVSIVGEALEQVVLPELQNIRDDIAGVKKDISNIKDDISDLHDTTNRIDIKLNSVVKRQDSQGDDIIKIQKVLKLEPKA